MNRSRITGDLAAHGILFADIANDRVGIGSTIPGNKLSLPDSAKIGLGNAEDLTLYHDGTHNYISASTAGQDLKIINNGNFLVQTSAGDSVIRGIKDGAVDLWYDNSKKLETSSSGITVTGTVAATSYTGNGSNLTGIDTDLVSDTSPQLGGNLDVNTQNIVFGDSSGATDDRLTFGAGTDLSIYHNGSHSYIEDTGTGSLYIDSNQLYLRNNDTSNVLLYTTSGGEVRINHNGNTKITTNSTGADITGILNIKNTEGLSASLYLIADDGDDNGDGWRFNSNQDDNDLTISNNISGSYVDKLTLQNDGDLFTTGDVNFTGASYNAVWDKSQNRLEFADNAAVMLGTGEDLLLYTNGSDSYIDHSGDGNLYIRTLGSQEIIRLNAAKDIELRVSSGNDIAAKFIGDGAVELYYDNSKKIETVSNGAILYGVEGGDANFYLYADEGDDNADKWLMQAESDGYFALKNYTSGSWETSIKATGNGAVELYYDNANVFYTATYGAIVKRPSGGNTVLEVIGSEGNNAQISLFADDGDDNGDKWRFLATDGSSQLYIQNYASGSWETNIQMDGNGKTELYHNDASRLMTTSDGVAMSSQGTDNSRLYFYTAGHTTTRIGYVGLNKFGMDVNGGLEIRDAGNSYETMFKTVSNGACELYHNGSKKLDTNSGGVKVYGNIDIDDNNKLRVGTSSDLQIYHSSSNNNSYIEESGGGYLILKSNRFEVVNAAGNEAMINAVENGAVDLYYDNDIKAGTVSTGFHIHNGNISMNDNHKVMIGTSNDLQIWHNGSESWIKNNTGTMNLLNDGTFQIKNNADSSTIAQFTSGLDCKLYYDNTWRLKTDNGGAEVNGTLTCGGINASGEFNMTGNGAKYLDFFTLANSNSVTFRHHNPSGNGFETFATFSANGAGTISHNGVTRIATDAAGETITGRTVWSGGTSIATQSCYLAAGSDNETQIGMYNGHDERQGFCFYNNGSTSNTSWGMITDQHDLYFKTAAYNIGNSSDLSSNWTTRILIDGSGHIHSRSSSTQYLVLGSSGDSLGTISNNMNWVRANGTNQQYNTAGGFHAWEVSGSQKMLLEEQNLFLRGASTTRIVLGSSGHGTYDHVGNDTNWIRSNADNLEYNCCDNGEHRWEVGGAFYGNITRYGEWRLNCSNAGDAAVSSDPVHGCGNAALDSQTGNLARLVMQERVSHWISFKTGGGTHYGSIYKSGSNVVYGGTSDYRLKENVTPITGAITTLKLLKPITYTWNDLSKFENTTDTHRGFLAHEVQEVEPDAVSGTKDGMSITGDCVDASGNTTQFNVLESQKKEGETWTKTNEVIDIQQLDERKLIPILTAALQEAITKIETLETKVATLESNA